MNFRITLNYLQKIIISLLFLINLSCKIQTEKEEPGTYRELTKALQNPLDVQVLILREQKLKTVPNEIEQLKNLQWLDLDFNQLTTLPKEIGQLKNLLTLYLGYNQLTTLPKEIEQLKNLQTLDLNNNQLSIEEKERIRKLLPKCQIYFE
ncbi:leucine-rich repeat domain-containing protein [Leptospira interrogans]|uniref:leucine-rich repeat domain-containing protein n=1 Tax=Leptospira interrogans TaxID=173 RepID=UPI0003486774|nr:leucine-rich repeat domain-containing protein [Leptospira interrogans]QCO35747.1 leucine-rich repeat domain-containing protein [Leptospira interrogans]UMQ52728.1 leucine-rich repeat domain-containing protein [Leptospira interrogans]